MIEFIKKGWQTVPLKGNLHRLEDGSKTTPVFEKGWKKKYSLATNTQASKIGGVLTGADSNIIAVDCDSQTTFDLFKALDPSYAAIFLSRGKSGGTFIYTHSDLAPDSFSIQNTHTALDFFNNEGFVYLPTEDNQTKVPWCLPHPEITAPPKTTLALLQQFSQQTNNPTQGAHHSTYSLSLEPLVREFTTTKEFMPGLFKVLTPKTFRTEQQYQQQGHLHPEKVPQGRGSEYLSRVSAILGADNSIDEELYCAAMQDINDLFSTPMPASRLDSTIIEPMISSSSAIDGVPIWLYDLEWQSNRLLLHTKRQSNIECGFDDHRLLYYSIDMANEHISTHNRDSDLCAYLGTVAIAPPKIQALKQSIPLINVVSNPALQFGLHDSTSCIRTLNTFVRTPELAVLNDPSHYAPLSSHPTATLEFLSHLVPEPKMNVWLLGFLKRKLTTFDYSPCVLYFLGVHGSGKDLFCTLLEKIMGKVARPTTREFLEMFNGWLLDTYFVQLDEYGNQLNTNRDKDEALGKLKSYTGKQTTQIRAMRTDGFNYAHNATFVLTANSNPFGIEDGDRRIALFSTPTTMTEAFEDAPALYDSVLAESLDFCYYLATKVNSITTYLKPPESSHKQELIASSMYASNRLAYCIKHNMKEHMIELAQDYGCYELQEAISQNRTLRWSDLASLYDALTDYKGEVRGLNKAMRRAGIDVKVHTSSDSSKDYYYNSLYEVKKDESSVV